MLATIQAFAGIQSAPRKAQSVSTNGGHLANEKKTPFSPLAAKKPTETLMDNSNDRPDIATIAVLGYN